MVAHAGHGDRRFGLGRCANGVHESRTGPPRGRVISRAIPLWTFFAIGGQGRVDQTIVQREHVAVAQAQAFANRSGKIGDEYIRRADHRFEHGLRIGVFQVECEAFLVAVVERPEIILLGDGHSG